MMRSDQLMSMAPRIRRPVLLCQRHPVTVFRDNGSMRPMGARVRELLKFRAESLGRKRLKPERLAVCYGTGDSMLPRIKTGDAILFDRADTEPKDGKLYVVTYDRQLLAKRLVNLGGRWFIESLNREHPK